MSGRKQKAESGKVATVAHDSAISYSDVQQRIVCIRDQSVIIDADVAALYGVETRRVNEAVRNNPDKFPSDYMFELTTAESRVLRSKFSTLERGGKGHYSKFNYKAFTEKGLYMLATILKSKRAVAATFAIIETFAKVRGLKRELVELHKEGDKRKGLLLPRIALWRKSRLHKDVRCRNPAHQEGGVCDNGEMRREMIRISVFFRRNEDGCRSHALHSRIH